ncbi:MAG: T9SS type A sorting domain-containing protein, partial [Cytophagales bacterium]|nr:T9SS type A sorting domain-containing protein [Cytophagales bacterium]
NYEFADAANKSKTTYYKLKSVDWDGVATFSTIEVIKSESWMDIKIIPNPNNGNFQIIQTGFHKQGTQIKISDMLGRSVYESTLPFSEELASEITISIPNVSKGFYLISINNNEETHLEKIVVE